MATRAFFMIGAIWPLVTTVRSRSWAKTLAMRPPFAS
jgi:hypothetical protein